MLQTPQLQQLVAASLQAGGLAGNSASDRPAMQVLQELVAKAAWCMEPVQHSNLAVSSNQPAVFQARTTINGCLLGIGCGRSKADASHKAAAAALAVLGLRPPPPGMIAAPAPPPPAHPWPSPSASSAALPAGSGFAESVQHVCVSLFQRLSHWAVGQGAASPAALSDTVLSCFLVQRAGQAPQAVSLGTGTRFCALPEQVINNKERRGQLLLDSHAEIIARRGLLRYLHQQAELALQEFAGQGTAGVASSSVLQVVPAGPACSSSSNLAHSTSSGHGHGGGSSDWLIAAHHPSAPFSGQTSSISGSSSSGCSMQAARHVLQLKPGVTLHMFSSKLPCGDSAIFDKPPNSISSQQQGWLTHHSQVRPRCQLRLLAGSSRATGAAVLWHANVQGGVAGGSCAPRPLLLPAASALACHWPQNCVLLHPAAAGSDGPGLLRGKMLAGENNSPLPRRVSSEPCSSRSSYSSSSLSSTAGSSSSSSVSLSSLSSGSSGSTGSSRVITKMCCSDKLARWNALGLQGSLLSQLLESPLYLTSITIAAGESEWCEGAVCRAACCRLAPDVPPAPQQQQHKPPSPLPPAMAAAVQRGLQLPAPFRVNHPAVFRVDRDAGAPSAGGRCAAAADECCNWNSAEPLLLEVTSGTSGSVLSRVQLPLPSTFQPQQQAQAAMMPELPAASAGEMSRISKKALFGCFLQLQHKAAAAASAAPTEQRQGMPIIRLPAGPACKSSLADAALLQGCSHHQEPGPGSVTSYAAAKRGGGSGYGEAQRLLYQHFQRLFGQSWLRRSEVHPLLEQFSYE